MPQSLSLVIVHIIFSTKERRPFLDQDTRPMLHASLAMFLKKYRVEYDEDDVWD